MKKDNLLNPRSVLTSILGMLLGVALYCGIVAPLMKNGTYTEIVKAAFWDTGIVLGGTVIVLGTAWLITVLLMNRAKK